MKVIRKSSKKIILVLFILLVIFLLKCTKSEAVDTINIFSDKISKDGSVNWYCIESGQAFWNYREGKWEKIKTIRKESKDGDCWHILGHITFPVGNNKYPSFNDLHQATNPKHSTEEKYKKGNEAQAAVWELFKIYEDEIKKAGIDYWPGKCCMYCPKVLNTKKKVNNILNDGYNYKVEIEVWKNMDWDAAAQKLIHVSTTRTKKITPVNLQFYKTELDGSTGISGAEIKISKVTNGGVKSISNTKSIKSTGKNGKFEKISITPNNDNGSFKINLEETTTPKKHFGLPSDGVILTVSLKNGKVTRNKCRNS